eukprot:12447686-Alexandrium_andersonii.AAC.2
MEGGFALWAHSVGSLPLVASSTVGCPSWVQATMAPNNSLAKAEKGPKFHLEETALPAGAAGEASLPRAWDRWNSGTPSVATRRTRHAVSAPPTPPTPQSLPLPQMPSPGQGSLAPLRPVGPQPLPDGSSASSQCLANDLFGAVLALAY